MEQVTEPSPACDVKASAARIRPGLRNVFKRDVRPFGTLEALSHVIAFLTSQESRVETEEQRATRLLLRRLTIVQSRRLRRSGRFPSKGFIAPSHGDRRTVGRPPPSTSSGLSAEPDEVESLEAAGRGESGPLVVVHPSAPSWVTWSFRVLLLLGAASFFLLERSAGIGRKLPPNGSGPATVAGTPVAGASDAALKTAETVIETIGKGDLAGASTQLAQAQKKGVILPGLRYQAALLALAQKNDRTAHAWIDQSIAVNDSVPQCLYLQAYLEGAEGAYADASESFSQAVRYAPFDSRAHFFLAESLRRIGHPALAIPQFDEALRCSPGSDDVDLILFKSRLARLESGLGNDFQAQLAEKLTEQNVSGDTLLLAAAREIERADYPAAAQYVRKAAAVLPVATLRSRLRDFAFKLLPRTSDLEPASLPAPAAPPAGQPVTLINPASQSLQQADPANW